MPFPSRSSTTASAAAAPTCSSTRACFPTSLPPRPKVASGSSHGGGRSISPSTPTGAASSRSSSIGKKDKIYYQRNGLVPKASNNNMSARDFNQDKRRSGSKQMILHVTHKDTAGNNVDRGVVSLHNESSRPTATIGRRTPTNKSKFKSTTASQNNNNNDLKNSCLYSNRDVSRQQSPDKSSYKSYNDNLDGDLYSDSDENSPADRDRNRAILEMLYGKPAGEVHESLPDRSTSPFGFVYGVEYRCSESGAGTKDNSETTTSCTPKQGKRFSAFLSGLGMRKLDRNRSTSSSSLPGSWLWQKSLSEGNLYSSSARKSSDDEYDAELFEEINDRRNNHYQVRPASTTSSSSLLRSRRKSQQQEESGAEIVKMSGMTDHDPAPPAPLVRKNRMEWERSPSYEYTLEGNNRATDPQLARTWLRNSVCTNNGQMDSRSDVNAMAMRQKSVPKFFRSISLRNLLPIGGMNKSRTGPPQGKRVSPPTVPGLVSFSSFRVKKSQQLGHPTGSDQQLASPSSESGDTHHLIGSNAHNKETQRYSGSSLGSAGSSYASSASSSDNRSSIGTDDGFLPPPCIHSDVRLKDVEEGVLYHPASQQIHLLKSSSSVDSFSSASTTSFQHIPPPCSLPPATHQIVDMHQGFYGKVGGINSGSNSSGGSSTNTNGSSISPHVTVHVDPHQGSANVQQQQQQHHPQQVPNSVGATNGVNIGSASASTSVAPGNSSMVHHQPHHSHHPHHHHHLHQNHVTFSTPATALSMTNTYQTQISLDDQGIDMTQSPGRESPSSTASSNTGSGSSSAIGSVGSGSNGCRHSTASFDSGRASSTIYQQGVRYSGLSSESSSGSFRHSYHSSSSSLGSIAPEEICNFDVAAMIAQGIPDHEVLNAWLTGIHFETYYQNFIQAGYDMHTISRMTPEDLNAIGVTKPHHRKRLKSEISQLNISDGLPDYIPSSIEEWLSLLKLDEYTAKLHGQGYHSVRQVTNITWEDLEDLGVLKLGHQKKFMLAIKRIEDILAGKRIPTSSAPNAYLTPMQDSFPRRAGSNTGNTSGMGISPYGNLNGVSQLQQFHPVYSNSRFSGLNQPHHQNQQQQQQIWRQSSHNASSGIYAHLPPHTLTHQPQLHHVNNPVASTSGAAPSTPSPVTPQYYPDVISIQVKNGRRKSMENVSAQEPIYGTSSFLPSQNQNQVQPQMGLGSMRSGGNTVKFEEGDITPTNETVSVGGSNVMSTATLPRLMKNKPIAKIMGGGMNSANCMQDRCPSPSGGYQQSQQISQYPYGDGYKSLPRDIGRMSKAGLNLYSGGNYSGATKTLGKTNSFKSGPPPPPRRGSCSGAETSSMYNNGQQILSSFGAGNNVVGRSNMPPPPPNLSCDQFSCSPPSSSRIADEFPPPPHPDDLALANQPMSAGISPAARQGVAATNAVATAVNNASPNNNIALKMNAASATVHYHNSSNSNHQTLRNSPPNTSTKSREPSPVGSDFSDSDLPPGGLLSRGVRRNGSDASFKSNSSTESESIPFANDNAGTIKQQKPGSRTQQLVSSSSVTSNTPTASNQGTGDVLNDIGNMLADLTDELDAILEQEMNSKR